MHKARHTASQRLLDATGSVKAVQGLLMHESVLTTGDIYVDWDEDRLALSLAPRCWRRTGEPVVPASTSLVPHWVRAIPPRGFEPRFPP
jgi:hypothetical protein